MKTRTRVSYIFYALFLAFTSFGQDNFTKLDDQHHISREIWKIIHFDTPIDHDYIPGILIALVDQDSTWILSLGHRNSEKTESLPFDAQFEIGSLTKVLVSSAIAQMVQEGTLDWDWSISDILPKNCQNSILDSISISELVSHQSGLPKLPPFIGVNENYQAGPYSEYSKNDLCTYINSIEALEPSKNIYSHVNFALLEIGLENHYQKPLQNILKEYTFSKLGMKNTSFNEPDELTPGYHLGVKLAQPREFESFGGSEGLHSNLSDLIAFSKWQLGIGIHMNDVTRLDLQEEVGTSSFNEKINTSRGWHLIYPNKKRKVLMQTGKSNGHHASIALLPQTKTGVVILSNSALGSFDLGYLILRMMNRNWKRKNGS